MARQVMLVGLFLGGLMGCGGSTGSDLFGDAGTAADGSTTPRSGGSTPDGGPGGDTARLACGSISCAIPGESCCVYESANPPAFLCVHGACPVMGAKQATALTCSGAANCPADRVCCLFETPAKQVGSACRSACAANEPQLCDPKAVSPGCGGDAGVCSSSNVTDWGLPTGYATCGGIGN